MMPEDGALPRPLVLSNTAILHMPLLLTIAALGGVVLLVGRRGQFGGVEGGFLLALYPVFVAVVLPR